MKSSSANITGNVTIGGNLTVNGTTTTINTSNVTTKDTLMKLGQGNVGTSKDLGFILTRGDGSATDKDNIGFIWDESADEFSFILCDTENGTTSGNVTVDGYANMRANNVNVSGSLILRGDDVNKQYTVAPSAITANRTITLPLLTGNDTFVFQSHSQTLTNKTFTGGDINISAGTLTTSAAQKKAIVQGVGSNIHIPHNISANGISGTSLKVSGNGTVVGTLTSRSFKLSEASTSLLDKNGKEMLEFATTDSAANHVKITNKAGSGNPVIEATGTDTTIDLVLQGKGTGGYVDIKTFKLGGTAVSSDASELNLLDGSSAGTIVNSKAVIYSSSGEMKSTSVKVTNNISGASLGITGNISGVSLTTTTADIKNLKINGTVVSSDAGELNLLDGCSAGNIVSNKAVIYGSSGLLNATTIETSGTARNITPGLDGAVINVDEITLTDSSTAGSGTATKFATVNLEKALLVASNTSVTTTDAATLWIENAPDAGTNQTITNSYALMIESGNAKMGGDLDVARTFKLNGTAVSSDASDLNLLDGSSAGDIVNSKAVIYGSTGQIRSRKNVESITATTKSLAITDSGSVFLFNKNANITFKLPDISGGGIGTTFTFITTIAPTTTNVSHVITTYSSTNQKIQGQILNCEVDTPADILHFKASGNHTITFDAGTKGGLVDTELILTCIQDNRWYVKGHTYVAAGTAGATPFS
jgi:hypothetical protein